MEKGKRLIYADDLLSTLRDDKSINGSNLRRVIQHINAAPAVDVVVQGDCDWCKPDHEICGTCRIFFGYGYEECSAHGFEEQCVAYKPIDYCPKCGRKLMAEDGRRE